MDNLETAVENILSGSEQADAVQDQDEGESLSSIVDETPSQEPVDDSVPPKKEPGWIKGRINKAVQKAVEETEARITAQYEQKLAPIYESMIDREAQMLVDSGEMKSLDMAKEYVRMKNNLPSAPVENPPKDNKDQNRDSQGRFAKSEEDDPVISARADILAKQAKKIKANRGVDVMEAFRSDPDVKNKVLSGEWDFYDVAESLGNQKHVSPSTRSVNGGGISGVSVANMTSEQFQKLRENLAAGRRYDLRK